MPASPILAMEARQESELPRDKGWQFEPKWDGFRCLAIRDGDKVEMLSRSGKSLARYFPDMVAALRALKPKRFILDGELAIPVGKILSFDALQLRLHPAASRVNKLAAETPSILIVFDLLQTPRGADLTARAAERAPHGARGLLRDAGRCHPRCACRRRRRSAPRPSAG